jgi:hypothetical protein
MAHVNDIEKNQNNQITPGELLKFNELTKPLRDRIEELETRLSMELKTNQYLNSLDDDKETLPWDTSAKQIIIDCNQVKEMLLEKNKKYGDSALNPVRIFSKSSTDEQIKVRIDDKLSRLKSTNWEDDNEDVILDLIGYLHLLRISQKRENQ